MKHTIKRDKLIYYLRYAGACPKELKILNHMADDIDPWELWKSNTRTTWATWFCDIGPHGDELNINLKARFHIEYRKRYRKFFGLRKPENERGQVQLEASRNWRVMEVALCTMHTYYGISKIIPTPTAEEFVVKALKDLMSRNMFDTTLTHIVELADLRAARGHKPNEGGCGWHLPTWAKYW
jgi:hypothetical protein